MTDACALGADPRLVVALANGVACGTDGLLAGGYAALAAPGGPVANAVTGLLTLFVGFYAFRLMLGRTTLDLGEVAVAAVKVGLVLVLAGNWAVYQQVVARTLFDAPAELARLVVGGLDRRGSVLGAVPAEALQQCFDELVRDVRAMGGHAGDRSPLLGGPAFATMMLNAAAFLMTFADAGLPAVVRIGLTLLLALGPAVAGFLLFGATLGLAQGWLRALSALALAALVAGVLLPVELAVLEPTLLALARERLADAIQPETALRAVFVIGVFLLAKGAGVGAALWIAAGLRLPAPRPGRAAAAGPAADRAVAAPPAGQPRAARIAAAVGRADLVVGGARHAPALALPAALAAGERYRQHAAAGGAAAAAAGHAPSHQRAARPRRELLIARRKR